MTIESIMGGFITQQLNAVAPLPHTLDSMLNHSVLRITDASMLIEDPQTEIAPLREATVKQPLEEFEQTWALDQMVESVKAEGFADHFHNIIGLFGSIMMSLTATDEQLKQVDAWVKQGLFGHFLMTDKGGPSLANWRTRLSEVNGELKLNIDKIHGIEAHNLGFAMVVAAQEGKPFPVTIMLPPELTQALNQRAIGQSFFDGKMQLGNCSGQVSISKEMMLSRGGLGSVNRFLTLVRPRFVKSLMHHILYLHSKQELSLDVTDQDHIEYLIGVCNQQLAEKEFSMHSVNRVLATKFASNEILFNLVAQGKVKRSSTQRDLLGFTKMEGSSYRCFFEIYSKQKGNRV